MAHRLKILGGFFFAQFVLLCILGLLERLGLSGDIVARILFILVLFCIVFAGVRSRTLSTANMFVDGHKMPPLGGGMTLALLAVGTLGYLQWPGQIYSEQLDGFVIPIGVMAGLAFMGFLFTPHLRRADVLTPGEFLHQRFSSRIVLFIAISFSILAILPIFIAQLSFITDLSQRYTNMEADTVLLLILVGVTIPLALGGMRAASWLQLTMAVIAGFGFVLPLIWWALKLTGFPLPHLAASAVLDVTSILQEDAIVQGFATPAESLWLELPGTRLGTTQAGLTMLALAFGIAAFIPFLARQHTLYTAKQSSQSISWALLLLAGFMVTLPLYAIFLRFQLVDLITGVSVNRLQEDLPFLFENASKIKICSEPLTTLEAVISACGTGHRLNVNDLDISPVAGLQLIPNLMQGIGTPMPATVTAMLVCGALAALIAIVSACLITLAHHLAFDLYSKILAPKAPMNRINFLVRLATVIAAIAIYTSFKIPTLGMWLAEPQSLFIFGLSIAAGGLFPLFVLGIWSQKAGAIAAFVSAVSGGGVTLLLMNVLAEQSLLTFNISIVDGLIAYVEAALGDPLPFAASGLLGAFVGLGFGIMTAQFLPQRKQNQILYRLGAG